MQFFLDHWHCILPVAALLIGAFIMNRGSKKDKPGNDGAGLKMRNRQTREEE